MMSRKFGAVLAAAVLAVSPAYAANDTDIEALRAELQNMRQAYEQKISRLESRITDMEEKTETVQARQAATVAPAAGTNAKTAVPATNRRNVRENAFNPSIGAVLQGKYHNFSEEGADIAGFAVGEEGERPEEGFTLDETELNFDANVDDKFYGSATVAVVEEGGEAKIELEEAYVQTLNLPYGLDVKAGRFFSDIGYLNSHHAHEDDFADRPLPYRVFLNKSYNDDGAQLSWILPTDFYAEIGGGAFAGDDFPAGGGSGADIGAWTGYGRVGGDIGANTSWRAGLSTLQADGAVRSSNEDNVTFRGDNGLYIADARMVWAPTGNNREKEVLLQGEYFYRDEDGTYEDTAAGTGRVNYDDHQSGFYAQGVYKFAPQWRLGARYSELFAGDVPAGLQGSALDDSGHDPWTATVMGDWTNSEFSRVRLQLSRQELADSQEDTQVTLQYIMSIGAHGAHAY